MKNQKRTILFAALLLLLAGPLKAQYLNTHEVLKAGQEVQLTIPGADTLLVTYRPGSNISETIRIPVEGKHFTWTPREAGIVALSTPDGPTQNVSVRFDAFPFPGFVILIAAGSILFGGALFASVKLFGKESAEQIAARPDT